MIIKDKHQIYNYSLIPLEISWMLQKTLLAKCFKHIIKKDTFLLVKHPLVFTLNYYTNKEFLRPIFSWHHNSLHKIDRGGKITCHAPGQIVVYLVINLTNYDKDLHWYIYTIEELIIQLLSTYNILAYRIKGLTGVWVKEQKITSIGIKISRWISLHGFSINLCINLDNFKKIIPCGISYKKVCSLDNLLFFTSEARLKWKLTQLFKTFFFKIVK